MKPFNLEEYLKNPNKKVVTRGGKAVKIYCTNYDSCQPIIAEIEGHNYSQSFTKDGKYLINGKDDRDLFFAPEKHEGWINLYKGSLDTIYGGTVYTSKDKAEEVHPTDDECYVATIKIEWEE